MFFIIRNSLIGLIVLSGFNPSKYFYNSQRTNATPIEFVKSCEEITEEESTIFDLRGNEIVIPTLIELSESDNRFYPIVNDSIVTISAFSIYTPEEWATSRIMYSTRVLTYEDHKADNGWNGNSRYTKEPYQRQHEGAFRYSFFASVDGKGLRFEGWACITRKQ